jgi:hypothetical protein
VTLASAKAKTSSKTRKDTKDPRNIKVSLEEEACSIPALWYGVQRAYHGKTIGIGISGKSTLEFLCRSSNDR